MVYRGLARRCAVGALLHAHDDHVRRLVDQSPQLRLHSGRVAHVPRDLRPVRRGA